MGEIIDGGKLHAASEMEKNVKIFSIIVYDLICVTLSESSDHEL